MKYNLSLSTSLLDIPTTTSLSETTTYSCHKPDTLVTLDELATLFKVHQRTAYRWTQRGLIPHYRIGRSLRFKLNDVLRYVASYAE
jgi:excisionase family DNA binding protein